MRAVVLAAIRPLPSISLRRAPSPAVMASICCDDEQIRLPLRLEENLRLAARHLAPFVHECRLHQLVPVSQLRPDGCYNASICAASRRRARARRRRAPWDRAARGLRPDRRT